MYLDVEQDWYRATTIWRCLLFTNILSFFYSRTDVINTGDFNIQIDVSKLRVYNISHTIRRSQFKVEIFFTGNVRLMKRVVSHVNSWFSSCKFFVFCLAWIPHILRTESTRIRNRHLHARRHREFEKG